VVSGGGALRECLVMDIYFALFRLYARSWFVAIVNSVRVVVFVLSRLSCDSTFCDLKLIMRLKARCGVADQSISIP